MAPFEGQIFWLTKLKQMQNAKQKQIRNNQQLFTEVEVSSGGYLPSRCGEVNIYHFHRHWGE